MSTFQSMYNWSKDDSSRFKSVEKVSRTVQSFKAECDINRIMARYIRTGVAPAAVSMGRYGDFSEVGSFHEAQDAVIRAQKQFAALSSKVRDRFKNDPANMLAFVADPKNLDEAASLGLLTEEAAKRIADAKANVAAPVAPPVTPAKAS